MEGMDISHMGLAIQRDGTVRFLHAPLSGARVQITSGSLEVYVPAVRQSTGIIVVRPLEPVGTR
jgi:hypothetical protein